MGKVLHAGTLAAYVAMAIKLWRWAREKRWLSRDSKRQTPLHRAAAASEEDSVRRLLAACPRAAAARDAGGCLPLHLACQHGSSPAVVQLLLAAAPGTATAVNARRQTPLHMACGQRLISARVVHLLLRAAPHAAAAVDASRQTPLHAAAALVFAGSDQSAAMRALLQAAPAAAGMRDRGGRTPLELLLLATARSAAAQELGVPSPQAMLRLLQAAKRPSEPGLAALVGPCLPLSAFGWASLPPACLAAALPAALAHSPDQARLLMAHLPLADAARLRTLALCLARLQRTVAATLPLPLLHRILARAASQLHA